MLKKGLIILFVLLGSFTDLYAEELPSLYRGIRPLGMGGAFITLSDDENAMFYNPSGLNDVNGWSVDLLNPSVEWSENSSKLYKDFKDLDTKNEGDVAAFMENRVGEHQHIRAAVLPNFVMRNFAVGVLGQATGDIDVRNPGDPKVFTDIKVDLGILVSGAYGFYERQLQIGATAKYVERDGINHVYTATEIASKGFDPLNQREKKSDVAFDLGMKFNPNVVLSPSFAVVLQNITNLDFGNLGVIPQQLNVGAAINPHFWILRTTFAVEVDDLTKRIEADKDLYKRTHLGAEVRFPKVLSVRAGINQGYLTAGIGIDLWIVALSYATYAEELGASSGQRADRRHIAQLSLGF
ncbi:MAG TPA: hypothetical protein VFA47_12680 [Candidatus Manganitrophaceae bacterium]|nr:hypothetical protein [Candidatus Manganitrophaceae bacterium]